MTSRSVSITIRSDRCAQRIEFMQTKLSPTSSDHYHFVTGRLAESAVRKMVQRLAQQHQFRYSIGVMPITVAALMTPRWLRKKLTIPDEATHVILPGYCQVGIEELVETLSIPVICGPNDVRALPELFGEGRVTDDLSKYDIEIIAEINHAPRHSIAQVVSKARQLRDDGADVIDFGCDPVSRCNNIGNYIKALVDEGFRVSVDTFDAFEASKATEAGASLVLSVNSFNREQAVDWATEVVAIPDTPDDMNSLHETAAYLQNANVPFRLDAILEPIGAGLAGSIVRYADLRRDFPDAPIMMGIGNLTELSDVDSAGVNLILLGICQELRIKSVLTTQVINWARSSVRECDIARRLVRYSVENRVPPKNLSDQLVMLRDTRLLPHSAEMLESLAKSIKDNNYRIFAQDDLIHVLSAGVSIEERDPFLLFEKLLQHEQTDNIDPGHAFYLGYEMAKASIALTLGKQYEQDQALNWGILTDVEDTHRLQRTSRHRQNLRNRAD